MIKAYTNSLTLELRLDIDIVGTELGDRILTEFQTVANPNFPLVDTGIECVTRDPECYEYYLTCVNIHQKKIDTMMDNVAKMLEETV